MNTVNLIGRLTNDPEMRYTPNNGKAVTTFTLAVNRTYKNNDGQNDADFIRVVAWERIAENIANYCKKGSSVGVVGSIRTRSYDDQDDKKIYITEVLCNSIQFLNTKSKNEELDDKGSNNTTKTQYEQKDADEPPIINTLNDTDTVEFPF